MEGNDMYQAFSAGLIGFNKPLAEAAPIAAANNFQGIYLNIKDDAALGVEPIREILAANCLKASGFSLPTDFRSTDQAYRDSLKELPRYAEFARQVGADRCIIWIFSHHDEMDYADNFRFHQTRMREMADILGASGIRLGMEFIGPPKAMKGHAYTFIHNLDQMLELCAAVGTDNIGLLLDAWHWDMAGQTFADFKKITSERQVVLVHVNDAPANIPVDEQEDLVRCLPGETGVVRIGDFLQGLRDLNYSGPVFVEPFSEKLKQMPFADAVQVTKSALDLVWSKGRS
jgi:sugar phosphate isomerase/epimerase